MIVYTNESIPIGFSVISNRSFVLHYRKAIFCEKPHQFVKFQGLLLSIEWESNLCQPKIRVIYTLVNVLNIVKGAHDARRRFRYPGVDC